ncbi:gastrula zinc finger protein XlCGF28.1-like [Silurus asotus]|uniref:Gastrula zinc finger protein XlCGF28.1-like n=1 Tax=Silurus asotus TaxID=30991 RepID=A0AAD4ZZU7_SILAS|nr:gastrula zinc finger protein XlCGF28.1-like [Silurus asotus]
MINFYAWFEEPGGTWKACMSDATVSGMVAWLICDLAMKVSCNPDKDKVVTENNKDPYVQMLFIDFSSAFNTIIHQHLIEKLSLLGLNTSLCNWILDFLTGNSISSSTTLSTGAPQGCVLSPLLFTLLTYDCVAMHSSKHIIKFADDMTVLGLISKNDELAYREEVQRLTAWCGANNLSLNVDKKMVVDFKRAQSDHSPLIINRSSVEIVKITKFQILPTGYLMFKPGNTRDLKAGPLSPSSHFFSVQISPFAPRHYTEHWSPSGLSITKKAQQCLYFLRRLRKAHLPPNILTTFYRGTIESILSSCITAWFGICTVSDHKILQRIVRTAEKIIRVSLHSIMDIYTTCCIRKAISIVDEFTHPSHTLFTLLPSGKRFRSIWATTSRLCRFTGGAILYFVFCVFVLHSPVLSCTVLCCRCTVHTRLHTMHFMW